MRFGLTQEQYQYIQETVVIPLKKQGATVWVFGSRGRGDHGKFSDLDLMVDSAMDISSSIGRIAEVLENGNFPYKVDMVQSREFAESYRKSFERDKVEL